MCFLVGEEASGTYLKCEHQGEWHPVSLSQWVSVLDAACQKTQEVLFLLWLHTKCT